MKKIILLFTLMFSILSFGQETFEGAWPPPGWAIATGTNGVGAEEMWKPSQPGPYMGHNSPQAAFIDRVNIGQGNTEEDWLIMNQRNIPTDGQLRFWTRQTQSGNQNTTYQIRVSTNADQMNLGAYTVVQSYTEAELTDLNGDISQYTEKFINFAPTYFGVQVYVAFVRVVTQTGPAVAGDRWLIDDVNIVQRCVDPDVLDVPSATILSTSAVLTWHNNSISNAFEVEVLPASELPTGVANFSGTGQSVNATGLQPGALMQFYVRSMCEGSPSEWVGPFFFSTLPLGSVCSDPISVGALPYQALGVNTGNYGDEVDPMQGSNCGATPAGTNYLAGHEIFYSYTAAANGVVSITMTPAAGETSTSLFVYEGCANVGVTCIAGVANATANVRNLLLNVVAGQTYIIVVSSAASNQTAVFDILIQSEDCTPKPTNLAVVPGSQTTNSVELTWTSPGITSWEVAVQPLGSTVPQGAGTYYNGTLPYLASGLVAGNQYQFWVRSECGVGSGVFSAWSGPFPINPLLCNPADKCGYTFRLTDTGGNGWQGNTLTVFQNGAPVVIEINNNVEVTTIGQSFTAGAGPHDVIVPLCPGYPYEIFWNNGGTNPNQIRFEVINPFGQVEYAKTTGTTVRNITLYESNVAVNCTAPNCTIPPTAVVASNITTTGFTLNWAAPATLLAETFTWDIFIVPAGSGEPSAFATPTYDNITVADPLNPSFVTVNPLLPDTCYEVYVRVNCEPNNSAFSTMVPVCTLPTCYKPVIATATAVTNITLNGATFTWTKGSPTDTTWEILLVPGPDAPPATPTVGDGLLYTHTSNDPNPVVTFTVNDLNPAQIYYFFVRTVCPGDDKSVWTGPVKFNTVTCSDEDKCNYKFVLTDAGGNGWNNGRMQVRQNGIVVFELVMTSGSTITRTVPLCDGVPFDVYWSVEGTQPQEIGFSIQNPFLDVLYTYVAGSGAPLSVVYSSAAASCTDNPCAKPTNIAVDVTSATTATLTWDDNSVPPSAAFDVYIVETGGAAPINEPATAPTHPGVSNPFNITGLTPSTSYTFYVRAQCGDAQFSTWTVLTPTTFITKPTNDECINAIDVTVNSGQNCVPANNAAGNTLGATASSPVLDPPLTGTGCLVNNRDVWYKFTASHTSHTISLLDIVVTPASAQSSFRLNYSVFSGSCDDLTKINCYTTTSGVITGLTVGDVYYIRVYPATNTATQSAEFKLCITSPPANDECANAPMVQVNPEWSCSPALYTPGNTLGASASAPTVTGTGCGTTDDDVWFKFTATAPIHVISLNNIVGSATNVNLNHGLYSGPCDELVKIYCSTNTESVATNLTPGEVYYVRVYTAASTAGAYATFDLCINTPPAQGPNDECVNAIPVPVNPDSKCLLKTYGNLIGATASGPNTSCTGTPDDDVWFSFVALAPRHIISLLNVVGTTTNLNHAVYQGSCGSLTQKYCSPAGALQSVSAANAFVIGQTYYVRVWSNSNVSQVVAFDICIKSVSTCENAESFCGSSAENPFIYENTIGIPDSSQVACLGSIPNPTFYTLHVGQTGPLNFTLYQADGFDANGNPVGTTRDVDYVAWGPFTTPESCSEISFTDCPSCPNNTSNPNFYPFGNIVDCSYSASYTETLSIPNAQEGEFYIILVTNFSNQPGYIRLVQTNFSAPNAGTTICCDVDLGDDITVCAESVEINALLDIDPSAPVPDVYEWFFNGSLTPIPGATSSTLTVTESGTYKVKALCGINAVSDEIVVTLGPVIEVDTPADYLMCEAVAGDGFAMFDLAGLIPQLGLEDPTLYEITFHTNAADAADKDAVGIDVSNPLQLGAQTIYIRVESVSMATCYSVVEVNLIVSEFADASFSYDAAEYCQNAPAAPVITITGVAGVFTSEPEGLSLDQATGAIDLAASTPGVYEVKNTILGTPENQCADASAVTTVTVTAPLNAAFDYAEFYCSTSANPSPTMAEGATIGAFTFDPAGLVIDPATGVIDIAASTPGTYTIFNTHPAASGCGEVIEQDIITITQSPDATFTYASNQYCTDDTANPLPVFTTGTAGQFSADSTGIALDSATGEINLGASTAGTYVISNTFVAADGCGEITETFTVQINSPATADFSYAKANFCQDEGTAVPSFEAGAIAGLFTAVPGGLAINSSTGEIDLAASSAGTYTVTNMANASGACASATDDFVITITAPYTGVISYAGGAFCKSSTSELISNTAPAGGTYDADGGLNINTATGEINPSLSTAGTYEVVYMLPANGGCGPFETATTVTIYPESSVDFDAQCISTDYTVKAVASNGSFDPATATYSWTTATGSIKPGTENLQSVVALAPGVYTVTVTTADGCTTTEDHNVTSVRCMFQKGISPDGNGENDSFDLTGYNVKHISIFNRWGTMVFQYDNYTNQWMGQDNTGDELPDGTYFFVIDTGAREESGWIYLNRKK